MSDLLAGPALDPETLEERLEAFLFAAPSHRSATRIANGLAGLPRARQEFALRWAEIAAQSYTELGYLVAMLAPQLLDRLGTEGSEALVLAALERYDQSGGRAAMDLLRDIDGYRVRRERGDATTERVGQSQLRRIGLPGTVRARPVAGTVGRATAVRGHQPILAVGQAHINHAVMQ